MINQFFDILKVIQIELAVLFVVFFAISFFWGKIYKSLSLKAYQSKQRLHQDEVPRVGGLIIYLFLTIIAFVIFDTNLLKIILISAIPIIFIGVKEDLFHNTSPKLRLIFMIASASLFIYLLPTNLPEIDFPLLNQLLSFAIFKEMFFIFSILVIINGNNLIDGVNGNMTLTNIVQLFVLSLLAFNLDDSHTVKTCLILIIPLVIFLIFNFPFGKIFIGDVGAYFYGFSISASIIYLFGEYNQLLSWNAVLILIYPSIELLFSFVRKKFFENKSPFVPDAKHLHSLIYRYSSIKFKYKSNSHVAVLLFPISISPLLAYFFYQEILYILSSIFCILISYVMIYMYFLTLVKNK